MLETGDKCSDTCQEPAERNLNATYSYLKGVMKLMNFLLVVVSKSQERRYRVIWEV